MRTQMFIAVVLTLLNCQRNEPRSEPGTTTSTAIGSRTAKRDTPIDVHGITVTFHADGMVAIQGRDRFGNALDTVYETVDFFRKALPVLEQSLTAEQSTGLRDLLPGP